MNLKKCYNCYCREGVNISREINKIKIFANDNKISKDTLEILKGALLEADFELVESNPDLCIAIGGDGSFLRMVKANNYDSDLCYVGINAGTLGFLQEIKIENINDFINELTEGRYTIQEIGIQETEVFSKSEESKFFSLNEIVIREKELNTTMLDIKVDNIHLENFVGDGILISTSVGSTAYNLSFGGSIVHNSIHTLQISPIAPLNNKAYRNLLNSVIVPESSIIEIVPNINKNNLLVSIDGDNNVFNEVYKIKTSVSKKRIRFLRLENYNFFEKINEKYL